MYEGEGLDEFPCVYLYRLKGADGIKRRYPDEQMTDSERLRTVPEGIQLISEVGGRLASQGEGRTSVLAVATYLPMDVDSVARVFEGLEEIAGVERIQEEKFTVYEIEEGERFARSEEAGLEGPEFLGESGGFLRAVGSLKRDQDWVRKVKEQHRLLQVAASARDSRVELEYLTTRARLSRARVQSLLNDFDAAGYIGMEVDEEGDRIFYFFPPLDYPKKRFESNMALLDDVEPEHRSRLSLWIFIGAFAVILLAIVMLMRF